MSPESVPGHSIDVVSRDNMFPQSHAAVLSHWFTRNSIKIMLTVTHSVFSMFQCLRSDDWGVDREEQPLLFIVMKYQ